MTEYVVLRAGSDTDGATFWEPYLQLNAQDPKSAVRQAVSDKGLSNGQTVQKFKAIPLRNWTTITANVQTTSTVTVA